MAQKQENHSHIRNDSTSVWERILVTLRSKTSLSKVTQVVFATLAGYATFKYVSSLIYRKWKGYPKGPFVYPVIGSPFGVESENFWMQQCGLYGAITYRNLFGINMLIINDSKVAKSLIFNRKEFNNRPNYRQMLSSKMIDAMTFGASKPDDMSFFHTDGQEWKIRRQYAMVSFVRFCDSKFISKLVGDAMNNVVFKILDEICDKDNIWYPSELCRYLTLNTVYHANFGHSLDINDPKLLKLRDMLLYVSKTIRKYHLASFSNMFYYLFRQFSNEFKCFEPKMDEFKEMYTSMIMERYDYFKSNPTKLQDIINDENNKYHLCYIDYLVYMMYFKDNNSNNNNNKDKECIKLTQIKIINDLHLMFFGATDTTSAALQFGIFLLAKSPDIQEKLYNTLKKIAIQGNKLELRDVNNCPQFRAFVFEVLRISSVTPFGGEHYLKHDTTITIDKQKYFLPGNSIINTNVTYIQRGASKNEDWKNEDLGLTMEDICLENWLVSSDSDSDDKNKIKFRKNESLIGFGCGSRDCVGQQLAIKEMNLILAHLILNYHIKPQNGDPNFKLKRDFAVITTIDTNQGVRLSKRGQN